MESPLGLGLLILSVADGEMIVRPLPPMPPPVQFIVWATVTVLEPSRLPVPRSRFSTNRFVFPTSTAPLIRVLPDSVELCAAAKREAADGPFHERASGRVERATGRAAASKAGYRTRGKIDRAIVHEGVPGTESASLNFEACRSS